MLARFDELRLRFDLPVPLFCSRKSCRALTGRGSGDVARAATLAAELAAAAGGADFIRTHEPRPLRDGLAVLAALKETGKKPAAPHSGYFSIFALQKFLGEGEWKRKKHGAEYRRQWRKLHIGIDAKTLQIRAIQLTTNNVSDSQVLGDLLNQIPQDEQIDSVYTDGAYDTKQCRQVIADRQAHAVIPPRKNAKPWKDTKSSSLERNELLRTVKHLGRTLWKKWSGYHRRSLVETKMHCIKLLGDKLMARSFPSQVNEIHARVAVLNRFTELGRPLTQVTP